MHVGLGTVELTEHVNHPPPSRPKPWSYLSSCRRPRLNMIVCIYEFLLVRSGGGIVLHSNGRVTLPHRHSRSRAKQIKNGFTALRRCCCSVLTHKADGVGGGGAAASLSACPQIQHSTNGRLKTI